MKVIKHNERFQSTKERGLLNNIFTRIVLLWFIIDLRSCSFITAPAIFKKPRVICGLRYSLHITLLCNSIKSTFKNGSRENLRKLPGLPAAAF